MNRRTYITLAAGLLLMSGCNRQPDPQMRDMLDMSGAYSPTAPSVQSLKTKIKPGMSEAEVVTALGNKHQFGTGPQNSMEMIVRGSDGAIFIKADNGQVTTLQPMPPRGKETKATQAPKVHLGMTYTEVLGALGEPNERSLSGEGGSQRGLTYNYSNGSLTLKLENDRVTNIEK